MLYLKLLLAVICFTIQILRSSDSLHLIVKCQISVALYLPGTWKITVTSLLCIHHRNDKITCRLSLLFNEIQVDLLDVCRAVQLKQQWHFFKQCEKKHTNCCPTSQLILRHSCRLMILEDFGSTMSYKLMAGSF